jgi:hypothetical protein
MVMDGSVRLIIGGEATPLVAGMKLGPPLLPAASEGNGSEPVAEVVADPNDSSSLELKNLAASTWTIGLPTNRVLMVEPGRSFRLDNGVRIDFGGGVEARVEV